MNNERLATFADSHLPKDMQQALNSERARVAYHEAGHIVVGEVLIPSCTNIAFLSGAEDNLSGLTKQTIAQETDAYARRRYDICISLGGMCATEHIYGVPEVGAQKDLQQAAGTMKELLAYSALNGMYHTTGEKYETTSHLSYDHERAAAVLLEQYRWDVRQIIASHNKELDAIAHMLYRKGYILAKDIDAIMRPASAHQNNKPQNKCFDKAS